MKEHNSSWYKDEGTWVHYIYRVVSNVTLLVGLAEADMAHKTRPEASWWDTHGRAWVIFGISDPLRIQQQLHVKKVVSWYSLRSLQKISLQEDSIFLGILFAVISWRKSIVIPTTYFLLFCLTLIFYYYFDITHIIFLQLHSRIFLITSSVFHSLIFLCHGAMFFSSLVRRCQQHVRISPRIYDFAF